MLCNLPRYLDQARQLDLDVNAYAKEMALGQATLHWDAGIDAQHTEFVLGCSTTPAFAIAHEETDYSPIATSTPDNFTQPETQL